MHNWKEVCLKDVLQPKGYIRGPFGSALRRNELLSEGIPVYEQQHAIYNARDFRFYIDEKKFKTMERFQVQTDDLIISCSGTVGRVSIIKEDDPKGIISQALLLLRADNTKVLPAFLKYFFMSSEGYHSIISRSSGSVQVNIARRNVIENIPLLLPPISQQERVVGVLQNLDAKIANNESINKNLFEQAQLLYKARFIDLMPYSGVVPKDWHIGTVSEIIDLHDSKRIPLSSRERASLDKIYPYYGATSIMDYVDRYLFDGIYLLLGEDGTVVDDSGYPILQYVDGKFWVNNHAHILTGKNGFSVELLYLLFSLTNVAHIVTGAVQPKISQSNLNKVQVIIPSTEELSSMDNLIQPIFAQIRNIKAENDRLSTLRDTLLPKLMSGEIDIAGIDC